MTLPTKSNFKIYQGSTFSQTWRWESIDVQFAAITGISKTAPAVITAPAHGLLQGWRYTLANIGGMKELNTSNYLNTISVTNDTIVTELDATGFSTYTSGGTIRYNVPEDLAGATAVMQLRPSVSSSTIIDELSSAEGDIAIDNINKTIILTIASDVTAEYDFNTAVYSLEITVNNTVVQLVTGTITLVKEITR